ncbi:MAG: Phosphoglycolate phosphatase [Methanonatronarchaeales archaeon]|nr:Phosphoglycolate phosphatase [Methanonatronarchaeales archaeon]
MHRLLSVDIDGTLTGMDRRLHLGAAGLLREVTDRGVSTVLATGNVLCFARSAQIMIGTSGMVIAENGGVVQMGRDEEPIIMASPEAPRKALAALREEVDTEVFPEERSTEVAVRDSVPEEAVRGLEERFDVEVLDTGFAYHIKNRSVDKGKALRRIAERLGYRRDEVIAIGDSENDVGMIEAAGTGVAVGNAHVVLRDAADIAVDEEFGKGVMEAVELLQDLGELP